MFGVAVAASLLGAALVGADQTTYPVNAICNNDQLMRWFDSSYGLWEKPGNEYYWWNSANALTTFSELAMLQPNVKNVYGGTWGSVYNNAPSHNPVPGQGGDNGFLNDFYDDEGWWGLAWVAALDATGNSDYLNEAISIWYDMKAGWNKQQCGGLPWNKTEGVAAVAISNELYIALGAALSNRVGMNQKFTYLDAATDAWNWFQSSGLINSDNLIQDGINAATCKPEGTIFTYNQGVILGALVELFKATGQLYWIDTAQQIADAVTAPGSPLLDSNGILADGCDLARNCAPDGGGTQFKGIFARNLKYLHAIRPSQQYLNFIEKNAQSVWQNDLQLQDGGDCLNGAMWDGPYVTADASSQSSALDCLVAAEVMTTQGQALQAPAYVVNDDRANAVKEAFSFAWNGYVKYAFPHDSLQPVDNTYQDNLNGWGASAIDGFDTAIVMDNVDAVNTILDFIPTIDFNYSPTDVSFFETSIRYLGGLLSAYDLLSGPKSNLINGNMSRIAPILSQAQNLANNLKYAYNTPSGLNINGMDFYGPNNISIHHDAASGTAGCTLPLEWGRLSDLTNNTEYQNLNMRAVSYFLTPYPQSSQPFPGLIGSNFDPNNGHALDASGGWIGGSDSFYEYLIKSFVQNKAVYEKYKEKWVLAADSSIRFLASNPKTRTDLTWLATFDNTTLSYYSEHLSCFDGGNFILGGLTLGEPKYVQFGLQLTDSCHAMYNTTSTGIGPDSWFWQDVDQTDNGPPADQAQRFDQDGYWINDASYRLRPEVLESYYYAYRATGDSKYQDWSWDAFVAINSTCRVGSGFAELNDVNDPSQGFTNVMDSYFLAEVLKYGYLIHAEDAEYQTKANQTNTFVFNTEAHPIRIAQNGQS